MSPEELDQLYGSYQRYAWRLECRDVYSMPDEDPDFADFLAGRPFAAETVENSAWLANVAAQRAAGKDFGRVRLIGHPITDYTRFEWACYPDNVAAGEDVRVLDRRWLASPDEEWTRQDFWLFDDAIAVLQHYDGQGRFLGVTQASDPSPYIAIRNRAIDLSVSWAEYRLVPDQRQAAHDRVETSSRRR